jgi:pimeloyl-ACP methyl ester carboxylesterase
MESNTIDVNGIRMRWLEHGEGPPVVFVHGIPTCPRLWRHVMPRIHGARSLAWEMVGYGASMNEGRNRDISVAKQADYLAEWMRAMGLDQAVVVGHDLGGGVAKILAVKHRPLVGGLVLMNAIAYDSWPIPSVKMLRAMSPLVERFPTLVLRLVQMSLYYRGHDDLACARESMAEHWQHYASPDGAAAFARQLRSLDVQDTLAISGEIPDLRLPVRLVWGAADQFQKIGYGYRLAYELGATIDRIEAGKHFVPEDHAQRVAAAVTDVLQQAASNR